MAADLILKRFCCFAEGAASRALLAVAGEPDYWRRTRTGWEELLPPAPEQLVLPHPLLVTLFLMLLVATICLAHEIWRESSQG